MSTWFDNHCHLGVDAAEVVERARVGGVVGMVTVGCDLDDSRAAIATASAHDDVWATAGIHPHEASHGIEGLADVMLKVTGYVMLFAPVSVRHARHAVMRTGRGALETQTRVAAGLVPAAARLEPRLRLVPGCWLVRIYIYIYDIC